MISVAIGGARRLVVNHLPTDWGKALRPHMAALPYGRLLRARRLGMLGMGRGR